MNDVQQEVVEIVNDILEIEETNIELLTRENYAAWDSLKHLEIIMAVEDEFEVRFTPGEIANVINASSLVELLHQKRVN